MQKVNIGSGPVGADNIFAKDWVNVDFAYIKDDPVWVHAKYLAFNIEGTWKLEDNSVDCLFASHVFEHIFYEKLFPVIKEAYRVLKPDAPIRIICPDPRIFIRNWEIGNEQFLFDCYGPQNFERWDYEHNSHIGFSDMFFGDHYDHHLIISIDILKMMLVRAGFQAVYEMSYTNTQFPEFFGTDQPDKWGPTVDNRPVMSYYLEAVK